jgi:energy-coupling factor transport system ATP-binding protein
VLEEVAGTGTAVVVAEHRQDTFGSLRHRSVHLTHGRLGPEPADAERAERVTIEADRPTVTPIGATPPVRDAPDIVLEGIRHVFSSGVTALDGVDLAIRGGEAVALVGPNGSGKTTLVRHLNGLLRPTVGRVTIGGLDSTSRPVAELARSVAVGFQDPDRQIFARSVMDEIGFGPHQLGRSSTERERAIGSALAAVGLEDVAHVHPADLGASQRKLLAIASLLAMECPVLVLDEPTAGLDAAGVLVVERIVADHRAQGRTVVAVSHDEGFVARSFERVVRMDGGRIAADGRPVVVPLPR